MSYGLSFSPEFYYGEGYDYCNLPPQTDQPKSLLQALVSMPTNEWERYCDEVLRTDPDTDMALVEAMTMARETVNTCSNLTTPVEVWLDPDGFYTVRVY